MINFFRKIYILNGHKSIRGRWTCWNMIFLPKWFELVDPKCFEFEPFRLNIICCLCDISYVVTWKKNSFEYSNAKKSIRLKNVISGEISAEIFFRFVSKFQESLKGVRHDLKTHPRAMKILALTNFGVLSSKMTLIKIFLSYLTHFQSPASSFHSC